MNMPYLNVYGQRGPHDNVLILSNREALEKLLDLVKRALECKEESDFFFASDGEGYRMYIKMVEGMPYHEDGTENSAWLEPDYAPDYETWW